MLLSYSQCRMYFVVPSHFSKAFKVLRLVCNSVFKQQCCQKSFYVTTPIFYVNAPPHIGHLYTATLADADCRWQKLTSSEGAKLVTGTDEHGLKVLNAAVQHGLKPEDYCHKVAQK